MSTPPRNGKAALVTGVAGQDGGYLTRLLLTKGYVVHGMEHAESGLNLDRVKLLADQFEGRFVPILGDLTNKEGLKRIIQGIQPDEIYNLAAQSNVQASFDMPEATFEANAQGPANLIGAILTLPSPAATRLFQASTSELFGGGRHGLVSERTGFNPQNPYAQSKLQAHDLVIEARQRHGLHASNGILFNHESPLRGEAFVTRKISRAVASIHLGRQERLVLGNLDSHRDWGHAREYVEAMWLMLQQDAADDYIVATGIAASIRDFVGAAFSRVGVEIMWRGAGLDEQGLCVATGRILVEVDPHFFRPSATDSPIGDASKARMRLGWSPQITWRELCFEMVDEDVRQLTSEQKAGLE